MRDPSRGVRHHPTPRVGCIGSRGVGATDSAAVAPASPTGGHMSEADQGAARVRELSHFIDGQRAAGTSGQFADVYDPALGRVTARVPVAKYS